MTLPPRWISVGGLLLTAFVVGVEAVPLGVPGEWVWPRMALPESLTSLLDRLIGPLAAAGVVWGLAAFGQRRLRLRPSGSAAGLLVLLYLCSLIVSFGLPSAAPSPHRDVKHLWIIYDRYASGYFLEAAHHITSVGELLRGYEDRMAQGDVLHEGTHPPGLYVANRLILNAVEAVPGLENVGLSLVSAGTVGEFRQLEAAAAMGPRLSDAQLAALALVALSARLLLCAAPLTVFALGSLLTHRVTAWRAACLTLVIPALHLFFPKSDVVFATTATLFLWLGIAAVSMQRPVLQFAAAAAAALIIFAGMLLSLAHLPAIMVWGMASAAIIRGRNDARVRSLIAAAVVVLTFVSCCVAWSVSTGCPLLRIWQMNLANHAGFYEQYPRTIRLWMLVNPLELMIAAGAPLFVHAMWGAGRAVRTIASWLRRSGGPLCDYDAVLTAMLLTLLTLWLTGRNSGEAARLWCFLTPWLALMAARALQDAGAAETDRPVTGQSDNHWQWLLSCQTGCAVLILGRISGFLQL